MSTNPADGPNHIVVYTDAADELQGYMIYTLRRGKVAHASRPQELVIRDVGWLMPEAYLALWNFIAKHDLVGRVHVRRLPVETPEIRLSTAALAALYSGKRTAYTLANWGLLRGDAHAIATASQLFQTRYAPHCPDHF